MSLWAQRGSGEKELAETSVLCVFCGVGPAGGCSPSHRHQQEGRNLFAVVSLSLGITAHDCPLLLPLLMGAGVIVTWVWALGSAGLFLSSLRSGEKHHKTKITNKTEQCLQSTFSPGVPGSPWWGRDRKIK